MGVKPEWYFLPAYQFLKYVPEAIGVLAPPLLLLGLILLPFLFDRSPERHPQQRLRVMIGGVILGGAILLLGLLGQLSETTHTFLGRTYHFDIRGWPQVVEKAAGEQGP